MHRRSWHDESFRRSRSDRSDGYRAAAVPGRAAYARVVFSDAVPFDGLEYLRNLCQQSDLERLFQPRVPLLSRSCSRLALDPRSHHRRVQEFHVRFAHRGDRLLSRSKRERWRGRGGHRDDIERRHRDHGRDRRGHALQHCLRQLFPDMTEKNSHMVELRDVEMQFEEKKVLDGFSLAVEPEDRLVIMGQSGSGKSTILRLILGILQPNAGSIFFKQFEITRLKRRKLQQVRRHIGMVYQYSALLSSRNVRDNVSLPLQELTYKPPQDINKIVDATLNTPELIE